MTGAGGAGRVAGAPASPHYPLANSPHRINRAGRAPRTSSGQACAGGRFLSRSTGPHPYPRSSVESERQGRRLSSYPYLSSEDVVECQACRDLLKLICHDVFPEHSGRIGATQDCTYRVLRLEADIFPKRVGEEAVYLDGPRSVRSKK